jgi:hypothetical protein
VAEKEGLEREETAQKLCEAELHLQQEQLAHQKERDAWDRERKKLPAAQAKIFGDVLSKIYSIAILCRENSNQNC